MLNLEWTKEYELGIKKIDKKHKKLFELIKEVDEAPFSDRKKLAEESIDFLTNYALEHFTEEEEIMKDWHGNIQNKREHREFIKQVESFKEDLEKKGPLFLETILMYLKNWLIRHILSTDKGFIYK